MKITLRGLLKLYLKFIDTLKANTEVDYTRFIYWLKNYIGLKKIRTNLQIHTGLTRQ